MLHSIDSGFDSGFDSRFDFDFDFDFDFRLVVNVDFLIAFSEFHQSLNFLDGVSTDFHHLKMQELEQAGQQSHYQWGLHDCYCLENSRLLV